MRDYLEAEMIVDGVPLIAFEYGPLDLVELERGLRQDGTFFIWTCWCGVPGCGGNEEGVDVHYDGDLVYWDDRDMKRAYVFRLDDLRRTFASSIDEARQLLSARPSLKWAPDGNRRLTD